MNGLRALVTSRVLLAAWFVFMVYTVDPALQADPINTLYVYLLGIFCMQMPVVNHSFRALQYPIPQLLYALTYMEIGILASIGDPQYVIFNTFFFILLLFGCAIVKGYEYEYTNYGYMHPIAYVAHCSAIATMYSTLIQDPNNILILMCFMCCFLHFACVRFLTARHTCTWQTISACCGRIVTLAALTCVLYFDSVRDYGLAILFPLLCGIALTDFIHISNHEEEHVQQQRSILATSLIFTFAKLCFAAGLEMDPWMFEYRSIIGALLVIMHASQCYNTENRLVLDIVLVFEFAFLMLAERTNPFMWSAFAIFPYLKFVYSRTQIVFTLASLQVLMLMLQYVVITYDVFEKSVLLISYPFVMISLARYQEDPIYIVWWILYGICIIGMMCTVEVHETWFAVCMCFAFACFVGCELTIVCIE